MAEVVAIVGAELAAPSPQRGIDGQTDQGAVRRFGPRGVRIIRGRLRSGSAGQSVFGCEAAQPGVGFQVARRVIVRKSWEVGDRRVIPHHDPGQPEGRRHRISPHVGAGQNQAALRVVELLAAGGVAVFIARPWRFGGRRRRRRFRRRRSHVGTNGVQIALRPRRREQTRKHDRAQNQRCFAGHGLTQGRNSTNNGGRRVSNSCTPCQPRLAGLSCPFSEARASRPPWASSEAPLLRRRRKARRFTYTRIQRASAIVEKHQE